MSITTGREPKTVCTLSSRRSKASGQLFLQYYAGIMLIAVCKERFTTIPPKMQLLQFKFDFFDNVTYTFIKSKRMKK